MKYFIDTHDKTKGSFPTHLLTEDQFLEQFDVLDKAAVRGSGKTQQDHRVESSMATLAKLHGQGDESSHAMLAQLVA